MYNIYMIPIWQVTLDGLNWKRQFIETTIPSLTEIKYIPAPEKKIYTTVLGKGKIPMFHQNLEMYG